MSKFIRKKPWKLGTVEQELRKLERMQAQRNELYDQRDAAEAAGDPRRAKELGHKADMMKFKVEHQTLRYNAAMRRKTEGAADAR